MPSGALAQCLLTVLAAVPLDASNPFEHAPFTFPTFRSNMLLSPLPSEDEAVHLEDESLDVNDEDPYAAFVEAKSGFGFSTQALKQLGAAADAANDNALLDANHFYSHWYWSSLKSMRERGFNLVDSMKRIDLVGPKTVLPEGRTDEGWWAYRKLMLAVMNRSGGIMDIVLDAMKRHRATPAERLRDEREDAMSVNAGNKDPLDVPIPAPGTEIHSPPLLQEIAERVFGPESLNDRGSVISHYKTAVEVLAHRGWEKLFRKLKTALKKSRKQRGVLDELLCNAKQSEEPAELYTALRQLKIWRATSETTLETGEAHFLSREKDLGSLFLTLGVSEEESSKTGAERKRGGTKAKQSRSVLPTEAEVAEAHEHWNNYCEGLSYKQACPIPLGSVRSRVELLEDDEDVGMNGYRSKSKEKLWEDLGLSGATQFPFAEPGGEKKAAAIPHWHQIAAVNAIMKGAFTAEPSEHARPMMLCDDVGLGKTFSVIGGFSMIAHLAQQQQQHPEKKLQPPPLATDENKHYFAGLDHVPNRPSLIVVPRTLASQWMEQIPVFTEAGSFRIVRFSSEHKSLGKFFSDPKGDYMKAAGPNGEHASRVIVVAEMSAIAAETARCYMPPAKRAGRATQRQAARGDPEFLKKRSGVNLTGTIFAMLWNMVAYDESHSLRNINMLSLAAVMISVNALLRIGATATPIFTGPKDIASQGRVLRHEPMIGDAGEKLHEQLISEQRARTKEWDDRRRELLAEEVKKETLRIATEADALDNAELMSMFYKQACARFESDDQIKIVRAAYIHKTSIDTLRRSMRPIILRRTGTSKDFEGKTLINLPPYQTKIAWSPLKESEQAGVDAVNEVHEAQVRRRKRGKKRDLETIKWENFLLSQKEAALHPMIVPLAQQEKEEGLREGKLTHEIPNDWTADNLKEKAPTRLLKADKILQHFWDDNPKPPVYREDGTRDLAAEERQDEPEPLAHPRKFLVYAELRIYRHMMKKVMSLRGRGFVEYDGQMSIKKREQAVEKFENDPECRVMLISNVGSAGLNLSNASIVIFLSGVWSGLEKKQIIGRAWRFGQTAQVYVFDVYAPHGLDLALAGYAGAKTVMSESFLKSERQLFNAHQRFLDLERRLDDLEATDEEDDDDAPPLHGLSPPKKSKVVARTRKRKLPADSDDEESEKATVAPPSTSKKGLKATNSAKRLRSTAVTKPTTVAAASAAPTRTGSPTSVKRRAPKVKSLSQPQPEESLDVQQLPTKKLKQSPKPLNQGSSPPPEALKIIEPHVESEPSQPSSPALPQPASSPCPVASPLPPLPSSSPPPLRSSSLASSRISSSPPPFCPSSPPPFSSMSPAPSPASSAPQSWSTSQLPSHTSSSPGPSQPSDSVGGVPSYQAQQLSTDQAKQKPRPRMRVAPEGVGSSSTGDPDHLFIRGALATDLTRQGKAPATPAFAGSLGLPQRRSPISSRDTSEQIGHKIGVLSMHARGTATPVRASGTMRPPVKPRAIRAVEDAVALPTAGGQASAGPRDQLYTRSSSAVVAPSTAQEITRDKLTPAVPLSKRKGFIKQSAASNTSAAPSKRDARTAMLDEQDRQLDKAASAPQNPPSQPRPSMFQ